MTKEKFNLLYEIIKTNPTAVKKSPFWDGERWTLPNGDYAGWEASGYIKYLCIGNENWEMRYNTSGEAQEPEKL